MKKSKIKYGKKDLLPPGNFDPKDSEVVISFFIPGDLLQELKKEARRKKLPLSKVIYLILESYAGRWLYK